MPTRKIGVYTIFFEYANFRLPLSIFLVNVLKHYRIHISQQSVIGVAKVSHFEILCRVHGFEPIVGLFRCFYVNSKNKGWMSFSKRKVRIGERQRGEDEPKLLETTVGRVVLLLPVAPACSLGEVEASVDKLFDEGCSGEPSHPAGEVIPTLPFVTSFVSTTPEPEGGDHTQSLAGANLPEIDSVVRTFVPIMTSVTTTPPTTDLVVISKEKLVGPFVFGANSSSAGGSHPIPDGFFDGTGSDFLIGGIHTMSLSAEVRMRAEYNIREKMRLKSVVTEQTALLKFKEKEIRDLRAQLLGKEAEAVEAIFLYAKASQFEVVEKSLRDEVQTLADRKTILWKKKSELDVKVANLAPSVKVGEQEVVDMDDVVTYIKLQNDNLADQVQLVIAKCLNSTEYLFTLGAAIGKAVEKGMHNGLSAGITHSKEGRVLANVASYNPFAKVDYNQIVVGATALSLSLDVSHARVKKIKENIENHRSALHDVFIPLAEPFSVVALEGTGGTFETMPATADTITALSTTLTSTSTIILIFVDDYEVAGTDDQGSMNENVVNDNATGGDVNPFPNVDDAELNVPE
nr:transposase (putative), gypsy type [Tanacetum cinerariifolium]